MQEIYLDNAATTRPYDEVIAIMNQCMAVDYGNPSSLHSKGMQAEAYLRRARDQVAASIGAKPEEIYFTPGATYADNIALFGAAKALGRRGRRIITSAIEHPAVAEAAKALEAQGYEVVRIGVDTHGAFDFAAYERALTPDTILVSMMLVNNEVGTILPVKEIFSLAKKRAPLALTHCDAVQGYTKLPVKARLLMADMISLSAHKIHGPKGVGALYLAEKAKIRPLFFGGGQEGGVSPGTHNLPAIAGFGLAAQMGSAALERHAQAMNALKQQLITALAARFPEARLNTPANSAPHIVNVSFPGYMGENLLHYLESRGIYVSVGSACAANKGGKSTTLTAQGVARAIADSALRISFSAFNDTAEVKALLEALEKGLAALVKR